MTIRWAKPWSLSLKTTRARFFCEKYKELIAKLKEINFPIRLLPCAIRTEQSFQLIYKPWLNNMHANNDIMQLQEATLDARYPQIYLFRYPPTTFQNNAKSWQYFFLRENPKRRSAANSLTGEIPSDEDVAKYYKQHEAYDLTQDHQNIDCNRTS